MAFSLQVDRHLGKGTLGTVYAARSLCDEDGAQVAIKEVIAAADGRPAKLHSPRH